MARLAVRGSPAIRASPAPRGRQKMPRASFGGQGGARVLEVVNMPETPGTQHNSAWMVRELLRPRGIPRLVGRVRGSFQRNPARAVRARAGRSCIWET